MTRADFRIRKTPHGFRVWQRITARKWEPMSDVWPTREDARAWVAAALELKVGK